MMGALSTLRETYFSLVTSRPDVYRKRREQLHEEGFYESEAAFR